MLLPVYIRPHVLRLVFKHEFGSLPVLHVVEPHADVLALVVAEGALPVELAVLPGALEEALPVGVGVLA